MAFIPFEPAQTSASRLFQSLSETQRRLLALAWDDPRRLEVDAHWRVVPYEVGTVLTREQQAAVSDVYRELHSASFTPVSRDLSRFSIAFFGNSSTPQFQMMLTGDDCTLRFGGAQAARAAFGGPVLYGGYEVKADSLRPWFPESAPRIEQGVATVRIPKPGRAPAGVQLSGLNPATQAAVVNLLRRALFPFREEDASLARKAIREAGGTKALSFALYPEGSWSLESPTMVVYFHARPHTRLWLNIRLV